MLRRGPETPTADETGAAPAGSADDLVAQIYEELRAVARAQLRNERKGHTLQTTALVHEAYLRLRQRRAPFRGRTHFLAAAAAVMRRVLVEHARAQLAQKRGGRPCRISLDEGQAGSDARLLDVLAVDEALQSLAHVTPRRSRVAELRLFAGLSVEETSRLLDISPRTVKEDWRLARAWLARRLDERPARRP